MEEEEEEVGELFNEIVKLPPTITLERERERGVAWLATTERGVYSAADLAGKVTVPSPLAITR